MRVDSTVKFFRSGAAICVGLLTLLSIDVGSADAQISRPGAHDSYAMEIEPHLVVQWSKEPTCGDEGLGIGGRLSFPVVDNGPIPSINNSLAVGVGLDFAFFEGDCWGRWQGQGARGRWDDGEGTSLWVPVDVQWNLFFAKSFSAFMELGLALNRQSYTWRDGGGGEYSNSDIDVDLVLWFGGRVHISPTVAFTFRLGYPSLLLGVSFLL